MAIVSDVEIRLRADIARLQQDMNRVRSSVDSTMNQVTRAANAARNALIGITAGVGLSELAQLTDGYTKFTAQLKLASTSQQEYSRSLEDVKRIATAAQVDIQTTGVLYARIASSVRELGTSQRDVAKITETVNLALAATGASASEASSAMLQLSQAFGSGVLRGEEFNAVNEAAPKLLRILADSMDIPFSKLRGLAEQGKLTTDILARAFSNDEVIKGLRENVAQITTISGALTVFRNNLMEVVGTQAHASGVVAALTSGILAAASAIGTLTSVLGPALKIGAAYVAAFVIAPPLFLATSRAIGNLQVQIALMKMEMASGATVASLFAGSLGGVSVAAQLASGSLTKLTLATNLLFSAYVGWEIGKYLESQFVEVEIAAEVMTGELLKHWERVKFAGKVAFDALTVFAREAVSKIASAMASGQELIAKGFRLIGDNRMAEGIEAYAAKVREATKVEGTFAGRTAESMAQMEKQIALIDRDTDRRSSAALIRTRLVDGVERAENGVAAAVAKAAEADKKAAAEAKKHADAYRDLIRSLGDRADATAREAAGLAALTTAEQAHIDLTRQLADGKIKLNKVQEATARSLINEAGANDVLIRANKEYADLQQQLADNARDLAADRASLIDSARQEAEQNEFLVQTFGMAEDAVIRLQAARLLEQEAQRLGRDLTQEEIEDLERVIELKERSAKAVASKRELEEAKQFWTDIDKTARDTFVSIADGGKNAFQRLKDTAKNVFFDWLYQQTIKKWIINIEASVSGAAGISGIAQAAGAGGGGIGEAFGLASSANSLYGALTGGATLAGGLGTGFLGSLAGGLNGAGIGSGLTSAIGLNIGNSIAGVVGSNVASGIATGLSGLAAAAPWVAGALSVYTIGKKAFGRGPKEFSGNSSIEGMFGASGLDAKQYAEWTKKGGWFRSDKSGRDPMELGAETTAALTTAYDAIKTSSAQYAEALGLNADSIMNRTQAIKISLGKDEAANQQAIADFFTGVADTVAGEILPNIAQFQQAGENAAATLQRVAVNFTAVDQILIALGTDSQTAFRAVGVASLEARERLVALTGGIEAFAQQASFFNENFLTQAEQIAIIQGPLNKRLEELGYAGITTTEQFKTAVQGLVSSGALATEEGAKLYAGLLAIAPQFKTVADYLQEVSDAAAETAKNAKDAADALAAQALADNEALLRAAVDSAFDAVGRAVQSQRDKISGEFEALMDRIGASIETVTGRISELTRLSDAIKGSMGTVTSDAQQMASRGAARAQVQAAIAIAKASGVLPSADDLAGALSTLRLDASDQFSSLADYQREVARTNNELATLGGLTDKQLTDAQKQLAVLEAQKAQAELQYQDEMMRLDGILEWAQAEVDAINGVDRSVQSVVAAIAGLKVASQALQQGATPSNPNGGNLSVEQLYRSVLGREGEAAGIAYWKNVFGAVVDAGEYQEFIKGAQPELELQERQRRQAEAANMASSRTMSSNTAISTDMSAMEARLDRIAAATEQFASQFNQVTAGGNAVLTEPA
jgi:tape measure domain-containing protein